MVRVDEGVPMLPSASAQKGRKSGKWPWRTMKIGDSFFAPGYVQNGAPKKPGEKLLSTSQGIRAVPGSKWAKRNTIENGVRGVRVWRVL